jgi:TorA maturation chaperone TorD
MAFVCEVYAGLIEGRYAGDPAEFFARHLKPWAGRLFADLEAGENARFYRAVGALARTAIDIEAAAAALPV